MLKIDLENHFYDQSVINALAERTEPPYCTSDHSSIQWTNLIDMPQEKLLPLLLDVGEMRKKKMEKNGISTAVISCSPGPEQLDLPQSIDVCRKTNTALYELTKRYPGLYLGSAILPVNDPQEACKELEKCAKEYGFVAWHTHSNYGKHSPDEELYRPIFKKAAELGIYVYIHPQLPDDDKIGMYGFTLAGPGLGFTIDTITTLTKMVVSGLFDDIPDLKVVLGHLGEAIPFLLDRMDNRLTFIPNSKIKSKQTLRYYFEHNILVTTSGNMSPEAFQCTKSVLGADHICFGSDYPYEDIDLTTKFLDEVPMSQEERETIFFKNAINKLHIIRP